jgi:hypothetical protein
MFGRRLMVLMSRSTNALLDFRLKRNSALPARFDAVLCLSKRISQRGCGRGSDQDFRRFLQIALGSASELDCELLLARDLGFMHTEQHDTLLKELNSVRAMLATLIRKIASDDKGGRT